jgi:hypothetical protein
MSELEPTSEVEIEDDIYVAMPIWRNLNGVSQWVRQHSEFAPEMVRNINFEPQNIIEKAASLVRRHKKAAAAVGGTALGSLGFAAGAAIFYDRTVH